jgi:LuxR family maltose regulon positive regulatory protein
VLIAQGRGGSQAPGPHQALRLLDRLLPAAEAAGRMRSVVEIVMLRALALAAWGDAIGAQTALERALTLAAPEGYIRMFVDEGAPMRLLIADCKLQIAKRIGSAAGQTGQRILAYTDSLLSHFGLGEAARSPNLAEPIDPTELAIGAPIPNLIEPLSQRELEVLRLIADGHSNQGIADRLVVAVSTIKKHVNNIYGKLDVQSRTQALARARELHLL